MGKKQDLNWLINLSSTLKYDSKSSMLNHKLFYRLFFVNTISTRTTPILIGWTDKERSCYTIYRLKKYLRSRFSILKSVSRWRLLKSRHCTIHWHFILIKFTSKTVWVPIYLINYFMKRIQFWTKCQSDYIFTYLADNGNKWILLIPILSNMFLVVLFSFWWKTNHRWTA